MNDLDQEKLDVYVALADDVVSRWSGESRARARARARNEGMLQCCPGERSLDGALAAQ
jgi:hypothetical protein